MRVRGTPDGTIPGSQLPLHLVIKAVQSQICDIYHTILMVVTPKTQKCYFSLVAQEPLSEKGPDISYSPQNSDTLGDCNKAILISDTCERTTTV